MKNLIFSIFFIAFSQLALSQYTSIFGSTSTSWNVLNKTPYSLTIDSMVVCCDTVINTRTYKQIDVYSINSTATSFNSKVYFAREDSATGQAWFRTAIDTNEVQILNMSLNISDTMFFTENTFSLVDSIYYTGGKKHLRLNNFNTPYSNCSEIINERFFLVEGVGFINNMQLTLGTNYCNFLLCKRKNGVLTYQNTSSAYSGYCNSNLLGGTEDIMQNNFTIYPNPTSSFLNIEFQGRIQNNINILLYDLQGRILYNSERINGNVVKIDMSSLSSGSYVLKILDKTNGKVYQNKVVKN